MFFATLKTVAGQVLMLYLISLIGFVTDKLGVFRQADAKRVIDLLFNIVLPIAIIYTFMTMAYTPDHVRGILLAFVCAFAPTWWAACWDSCAFATAVPWSGACTATVCCSPTPAFWRCLWLWR